MPIRHKSNDVAEMGSASFGETVSVEMKVMPIYLWDCGRMSHVSQLPIGRPATCFVSPSILTRGEYGEETG